MNNMSHCRFANTLSALRDCHEHMDDDPDLMSRDELKCREQLIRLCGRVSDDHGHEFE